MFQIKATSHTLYNLRLALRLSSDGFIPQNSHTRILMYMQLMGFFNVIDMVHTRTPGAVASYCAQRRDPSDVNSMSATSHQYDAGCVVGRAQGCLR